MGIAQERGAGVRPDVAFEVDRIEWPAPDRVEIAGRWFGVRGRRFVRPTLELEVDGEPRRMLALLDHKPWEAEDGEEWVAAFDWDGEQADLSGGELSVGPDVSVELHENGSKPGGRPRAARRSRASVREGELREARRENERLARKLRRETESHAAAIASRDAEHAEEVERLRGALTAAADEADRRVEELRVKLESERERLRGKLDAERRRAQGLDGELRAARQDIELGRAEIERARGEIERARAELDAARREGEAARRERDAARQERDAALHEAARPRAEAVEPAAAPLAPEPPPPPLPFEPPHDASKLRRIRPGLYRWETASNRAPTFERALAFAALGLVLLILLLFII